MLNPEKYSKLLKYPVKDKILVVFKKKKKRHSQPVSKYKAFRIIYLI